VNIIEQDRSRPGIRRRHRIAGETPVSSPDNRESTPRGTLGENFEQASLANTGGPIQKGQRPVTIECCICHLGKLSPFSPPSNKERLLGRGCL
jgi:hypothetical protein